MDSGLFGWVRHPSPKRLRLILGGDLYILYLRIKAAYRLPAPAREDAYL